MPRAPARWWGRLAWALALGGLLLACVAPAAADSGSADFLVGDLQAGRELIQRFVAADDGLRMVSVRLATYGRRNLCALRLRLVDAATAATVAERFIRCEIIADNSSIPLTFTPIPNSRGRTYRLIVSSSDGQPRNSIAAWAQSISEHEGDLRFAGQAVNGELKMVIDYGDYAAHWWRVARVGLLMAAILSGVGASWWAIRRRVWRVRRWDTARDALVGAARGAWPEVLIGGLTFVLFMSAVPYGVFADEYDNILGGRLIGQGALPHGAWFTHHLPFPYYLAALIGVFADDLWTFRAIFGGLLFVWWLLIARLCRQLAGRAAGALLLLLVGLSLPIYRGHLLLAETLIGPATVTLGLLVWQHHQTRGMIRPWKSALVAGLFAVIALSSIAYLPLVLVLAALFGIVWLRQPAPGRTPGRLLATLGLLGLPSLLLAATVVATGSAGAFLDDNNTFNLVYYGRFAPEIQPNPFLTLLLFMEIAVQETEKALRLALTGGSLQALFARLACLTFIVESLSRRRFDVAAGFLSLFVTLQPRVGYGPDWPDNHYIAPVITVSLVAASITLPGLARLAHASQTGWAPRLLLGALGLITPLVVLGWLSFRSELATDYLRHEATPLIAWSAPAQAGVINDLTTPADRVWVGPYDHETLLFLHARPASYYLYVLPWVGLCDECRARLLRDFATARPKIVVWDPKLLVGGYSIDHFAGEVLDHLEREYFVVERSKGNRLTRFHFRKEDRETIMAELKAKGYLD